MFAVNVAINLPVKNLFRQFNAMEAVVDLAMKK